MVYLNDINGFSRSQFFLVAFFLSALLSPRLSATPATNLYQQCQACHGQQAQGNVSIKAPALAGQHAWYISRQLKAYQQGIRGSHSEDIAGQQMALISQQLTNDADIEVLAEYLSTLVISTDLDNDKQNSTGHDKKRQRQVMKNGYRYYQGKCGACHGSEGQGNVNFKAPKLNHLSREYLNRQMAHFSQGLRGVAQGDKTGRQMAIMAKRVTKAQLSDIIDYLAKR